MDNEKTYRLMRSTGAMGLVIGIVIMTAGLVCGILSVVTGARLLKKKSEIIF